MAKSFKSFRKARGWDDDEWGEDDSRRKDNKMRERRDQRRKKGQSREIALDDTDDDFER
jgi:hypothetical protein